MLQFPLLVTGDCDSLFTLIYISLPSLLLDSFPARPAAELSKFETGELDFIFPFLDCSDRLARSVLLTGESKLDFFSDVCLLFLVADV